MQGVCLVTCDTNTPEVTAKKFGVTVILLVHFMVAEPRCLRVADPTEA